MLQTTWSRHWCYVCVWSCEDRWNSSKISRRGRKQEEEFEENPEVVGGREGNRRFHLATMSHPMTWAFLLPDVFVLPVDWSRFRTGIFFSNSRYIDPDKSGRQRHTPCGMSDLLSSWGNKHHQFWWLQKHQKPSQFGSLNQGLENGFDLQCSSYLPWLPVKFICSVTILCFSPVSSVSIFLC